MSSSGDSIAVVGAGRIGRGIALAFALAGHDVALIDLKERSPGEAEAAATTCRAEIDRELAFLVVAKLLDAAAARAAAGRCRWVHSSDASQRPLPYDIYLEGVPETIDAKRACYDWLNGAARSDAIFASSTSTILVDDLVGFVSRPERFLNAHWLNPAHLMPLVELSPSERTDPTVTSRLKSLLEHIGKVSVVCRASPGYIVPRLQALAMNEAARMVEEGVATAEDIDRAVRVGFGVRYAVLGLLEFIDWGGGDILYYASQHLSGTLDANRFGAPRIIADHMAQGRLGMRDGQGFYDYRGVDLNGYRRERMQRFVGILGHLDLLPPSLRRAADT